MFLPTTATAALLVLFAGALLLGLWANTLKAAGKHRFELYYFDFAFGALATALLLAFTAGSLGPEVTFEDNLLIAGKRQMALGFCAGLVFNLGNMLLVAGISVAGMAVAFPVTIGVAYLAGNLIDVAFGARPAGLQWASLALVLAAVAATSASAVLRAKPGPGTATAYPLGARGVVLSVIAGILLALTVPVAGVATSGDLGLSPFSLLVFMGAGIVLSTLLYNLYFLNLPVSGNPISMKHYARATFAQHAAGWLGGLLWACGFVALHVSAAVPKALLPEPGLRAGLPPASALVAALCGMGIWNEFAAAPARSVWILWGALGLFAAGLALAAS